MSLGEILVILIIALLVMKPSDIPVLIKKFHNLRSYLTHFKKQALSYITEDLKIEDTPLLREDLKSLNFYLEKIIQIDGYYDGDYSLEKVKARYDEIMKEAAKK